MIEEWRDIHGYEGIYQVSNLGNVKRIAPSRRAKEEHLLKMHDAHHGYNQVRLTANGKQEMKRVSRLVATAFIPNPDNLPEVNHIDENPKNNCVTNLEWCTRLYNCNYGHRNARVAKAKSKAIVQCDLLGVFIRRWNSAADAARYYHVNSSNISKCLTGKNSQAFGYIWKFVKNNNKEI